MVGHGFLFTLPHEFFDTAECIGSAGQTVPAVLNAVDDSDRAHREEDPQEAKAAAAKAAPGWNESGATCIACGIGISSQGFTSPMEQRQHFKTDWHRYNLRRRLEKKPPILEQEFEAMIEQGDDVSSISGSDTESSDSDNDSSSDEGQAHTDRKGKAGQGKAGSAIQGAQAIFRGSDGAAFAVWRCLLLPDGHKHKQEEPSPQQLLQMLRQLRRSADSSRPTAAAAAAASSSRGQEQQQLDTGGCVWALLMLRGGHFAAAVVRVNSSGSSSSSGAAAAGSSAVGQQQQQHQQVPQRPRVQQAGPAAEPFQVLAHKTFHRYVVRAKAGGKQSTKDATGKFARSAGSRLRRYNEAALQRDITQLLKEWASWLSAAQLIFLAAPGSNGRVLFTAASEIGSLPGAAGFSSSGGQGSGVLDPADARIRRVPFVTQRPTFSELKRVLLVLGSVRQVQLPPEPAAAAAAADERQSTAANSKQEQQKQQQQQQQLQQDLAVPAAAIGSISPAGVLKKQEEPPLIKAAKAGDADRVARLLANGHDPCLRDSKGRSPYQVAANKEVRDVFRRFMASAPDAWDYSSSDIPSALTEEMEAAQQSKKADKRARQKAKEKERKEAKPAAADGSSSSSKAAPASSFDDELAAAMAEAAAISSRAAASGKSKQVKQASGASQRSKQGPGAAADVHDKPTWQAATGWVSKAAVLGVFGGILLAASRRTSSSRT